MSLHTKYSRQAAATPVRVWYTGTDAVKKGIGLCYDREYTETGFALTDFDGRRSYVAKPTSSNNLNFAGVTRKSYAADAGGQWVEIFEPGSICQVLIGTSTVADADGDLISAHAGAAEPGAFHTGAVKPGRGAALPLQTQTIVAESLDGTASVTGTALTKTGAFATATAGDTVVILGGGPASAVLVPGVYEISSVTDDDDVVLTTSASTSAATCAFYAVTPGSQYAWVELLDGEECGLQEWLSPEGATAIQSMVGGITALAGGHTLATSDSTATLADATRDGLRKGVILKGALTTHDWLLTVTSGIQLDGATTLASLEFDAAGDFGVLEWNGLGAAGGLWTHVAGVGPTVA